MIQGIGYDSGGKWIKNILCTPTPEYRAWSGMICRCYSPKVHKLQPKYKGCTVSDEFLDFQKFAEWASRQHGYDNFATWQLDKDLIGNGREYGPSTCLILPREINNFLIGCDTRRGECPKGVTKHHKGFRAQCQMGHGKKYLGRTLYTMLEAFEDYKTCKEAYAKELAAKWQSQIDPRAYNALMNYTVDITD